MALTSLDLIIEMKYTSETGVSIFLLGVISLLKPYVVIFTAWLTQSIWISRIIIHPSLRNHVVLILHHYLNLRSPPHTMDGQLIMPGHKCAGLMVK